MRLEFAGVSHRFPGGEGPVISDLDVHVDEQRVGVIGANGSGKSTFARMLNGLVIPTSGTVTVDGLDTRRQAAEIRRRVGFCFTDPDSQIIMPTVAEDIAFGLRRRGLTKAEVEARVTETMDTFALSGFADHPAHHLSGGQKQLLALASILITRPDLVVMDEPTTLLDLRNIEKFSDLIAGLPQQVVLVTHHLEQLVDFDRVLVFDRARLAYSGPAADAVDFYRGLMR